MSGVVADPQEIRKFQSNLKQFNRQLETITRKLKGQLRTLGTTWRDSEYRKFEQDMNEVFKAFNRYLDQSEEYLRHLNKKAEPLERYKGKR